MYFFDKENYNIDDIISLIDNEAEESVHLDFKAAGSLSKDDRKKLEIAKDVSAFAVLSTCIFALAVGIIIFVPKIIVLIGR
jgi:phosphate/sulfate permease